MDTSVYIKARLAHKEGKTYLLELLETLQQMAWIANPSGRVLYFNKRWYDYTGMNLDQTEGWINVVHPEDSPQVITAWNQALVAGHYQTEYRIRNYKDGTYEWFLEQAEPIRDEAGKCILWFGTFTYIENQNQAIAL